VAIAVPCGAIMGVSSKVCEWVADSSGIDVLKMIAFFFGETLTMVNAFACDGLFHLMYILC